MQLDSKTVASLIVVTRKMFPSNVFASFARTQQVSVLFLNTMNVNQEDMDIDFKV